MKIVIAGPKGAGKSSTGKLLADMLGIPLIETDGLIEEQFKAETGQPCSCREIMRREGRSAFSARETRAVIEAGKKRYCVISTGGSTMLEPENRRILRTEAILVYLQADFSVLWKRIVAGGIPPFLPADNPEAAFADRVSLLNEIVRPFADIVMDISAQETPEDVARQLQNRIGEELNALSMRFSSFGTILQVHTFGESHGPAIGAVLDGMPPGVPLSEDDIQSDLNRRRPGQSNVSTTRVETDRVRILSGTFQGKTTGAPVALLIENNNQHSKDYEAIKDVFRPGHADFTFWAKYGIRDHRGGGRSSGRETAARVAGGAAAGKVLRERGIRITAYALEIGGIRAKTIDHTCIEKNPVRSPDPEAALSMEKAIVEARDAKNSLGGIIQLEITGVPAGLGDPVFGKLDARLGAAFLSVGAVKGIEFGAGFQVARMRGDENNDAMRDNRFATNHGGGILGGISTGETILVRLAIKPTPSIAKQQETCEISGANTHLCVHGRHDPCIVPRAVPVIESMAALVLLDCLLIQERLRPAEA